MKIKPEQLEQWLAELIREPNHGAGWTQALAAVLGKLDDWKREAAAQRSRREHITPRTKLAAALRELFQIPYLHAKEMTEDQVLSLAVYDHNILHAINPIDAHWNLTPRMILPHREKSKGDTSTVAKVKRLDDKWGEFMRTISSGAKPIARERRSRFAQGRKLQGRPFQRRVR